MTISEVVFDFFDLLQWSIAYVDNTSAITMEYRGKNGRWTCQLHVLEEAEQVIYYSMFPVHIPEDKRGIVLEFIT